LPKHTTDAVTTTMRIDTIVAIARQERRSSRPGFRWP
jgi:hypothetical protein